MYIRRFLGIATLALLFVAVPAHAALTAGQQSALLNLLSSFGVDQETVHNVQGIVLGASAQADDHGTGSSVNEGIYCPQLSLTMMRGARDATTKGQVTELQIFLADYFNVPEETLVSGYFGILTQSYVVKFQQQNGLPALGIVGSLTREVIAKACGMTSVPGGKTVTADLRVNGSDASGPFLQVSEGSTVAFTWTSTGATSCDLVRNGNAAGTMYYNAPASGTFNYTVHYQNEDQLSVRLDCYAQRPASPDLHDLATDVVGLIKPNTSQTATSTASIYASLDASSPGIQFVAGGAENVTVGVFKIGNPGSEAVKVNLIQLAIDDYNFSPLDITNLTLWDGATMLGAGSFIPSNINPLGYFDGVNLSAFTVPAGSSKTLTIKGNFSKIGTGQPGTSGHKLQVEPFDIIGTGVSSGALVEKNYRMDGGAPVSAPAYLYKSFPTVAPDTLPVSGLGDGRLMRFKVAADSHGPVGIAQMAFLFSGLAAGTNGQADLYAYSDSSYSIPVAPFPSGAINGLAVSSASPGGQLWFPQPLEIPAGAVRYFELRDSTKGTGLTNTTALTTTLLGQTTNAGVVSATSLQGKDGAFIWSPNSTTTSQFGTVDWTNGYGVPGLPGSGLTVTRAGSTASSSPSCTITSSKTNVASGETFTLSWTTRNIASPVMYQKVKGGGTVAVASSGSMNWVAESATIPTTDTFAIGIGPGTANYDSPLCSVSVQIAPTTATPTASISASPASVNGKQSVTLSWASTNANRCVLQYGGAEYAVSTSGSRIVTVSQTTTYTLVCTNDPGTGKDGPSVTASTTVNLYYTLTPSYDSGTTDTTTGTGRVSKTGGTY